MLTRYDMLELPEECPDYDYGLRVARKEGGTLETGIPAGRLNVCSQSVTLLLRALKSCLLNCYAQAQSIRMPTPKLQTLLARSRWKRDCLNPLDLTTALEKSNIPLMLSIW